MQINWQLMRFRAHGETPPTAADPSKVAANATQLLTRFGYSTEEIAALGAADEAKLGELFTARNTALETDILGRKGKEIASKANFEGMKHAYTEAEKRQIARAASLGIEIKEEDLATFDQKERLEGILDIIHGKLKVSNPNAGDAEKELQRKLESFQKSDAEKDKALRAALKKLEETEKSIPTIKEQIQAEYFAERAWESLALNAKTVETLSISDPNALKSIVIGAMAMKGHRFTAEKGTDGFKLQVVDREGNYVQMTGAAGNHSPETYINEIYAPIVKKSNAGQNGGGGFDFNFGGDGATKLSGTGNAAIQKMIDQAKAANQ